MATIEDYTERIARLVAIEQEYRVTVVVLAIVVEQVLKSTGGVSVEISDEALSNAPDLKAWRNDDRSTVEISVSRKTPAGR